ncbi:o-succinylbenzoate synthase [Mesonia aquimarina]|uniref:o-succinylbenzoate synthase n=1 Tax=Mesonia aquimarina TaxID=1504967 RepID=UPI000EF55D05|nr:o-succinylbenzoate synthase [Mesonia aquimarina]
MKAKYKRHILNFKRPSGTSRGVLHTKETWFLIIEDQSKIGVGECGILRGLSIDDRPDFEEKLKWLCKNINKDYSFLRDQLEEFPAILFGLEMAIQSLSVKNPFELFPSDFTLGSGKIPINGLIWMGEKSFMKKQIEEKIEQGFSCIKLKIGAIDFQQELDLLSYIRKEFSSETIELRVDANGAFHPDEALLKLEKLSKLDLHSIEQPIKQGQFEAMKTLCKKTPLPIALDEELIGVFSVTKKEELLQTIQPQYIILKPSLLGGFQASQDWISAAEQNEIDWWITSALESNLGLNAIAQWTYTHKTKLPQGLGTGSLYTNNIDSPLTVKKEFLTYNPKKSWDTIILK